jgi:hypothetical protein
MRVVLQISMMETPRKKGECRICGEDREIWAVGLCVNCYRKMERTVKGDTLADRHSGVIRKDHQKLHKLHANLMVVLGKLGLNKNDKDAVVKVCRPYWAQIAEQLRDSGAEDEPEKKRREQSKSLFTVHAPSEKSS